MTTITTFEAETVSHNPPTEIERQKHAVAVSAQLAQTC